MSKWDSRFINERLRKCEVCIWFCVDFLKRGMMKKKGFKAWDVPALILIDNVSQTMIDVFSLVLIYYAISS